jgi:hypothetical protein
MQQIYLMLSLLFYRFIFIVWKCTCTCVNVHCIWLWRPEESTEIFGVGDSGIYELTNMSAEIWTQILMLEPQVFLTDEQYLYNHEFTEFRKRGQSYYLLNSADCVNSGAHCLVSQYFYCGSFKLSMLSLHFWASTFSFFGNFRLYLLVSFLFS